MDFGNALRMMREGHKVTKTSWNNEQQVVWIESDDSGKEVLTIKLAKVVGTEDFTNLRYDPTVSDIMAYDWELPERIEANSSPG